MNPRGAASDSRLLLSVPCFDNHVHPDNRRDGDAHTPADRGGATDSVTEQGHHQKGLAGSERTLPQAKTTLAFRQAARVAA